MWALGVPWRPKNLALSLLWLRSLLWCGFDPWPWNFPMPQVQEKKKKKKVCGLWNNLSESHPTTFSAIELRQVMSPSPALKRPSPWVVRLRQQQWSSTIPTCLRPPPQPPPPPRSPLLRDNQLELWGPVVPWGFPKRRQTLGYLMQLMITLSFSIWAINVPIWANWFNLIDNWCLVSTYRWYLSSRPV